MDNFIPLPYRQVSVQRVPWTLDQAGIEKHLAGKECYKHTRFIILKNEDSCAVIEVEPGAPAGLFVQPRSLRMLAPPAECVWLEDEAVDTGNRPALAKTAADRGIRSDQTLVVEGKFGHVNFYHRPRPALLRVVDQVPPRPSRLASLVEQVLAFGDFPPVTVREELIELSRMAKADQGRVHIFPCHASGLEGPGETYFLDEHPPEKDWTMVGCERSEQIHRHFYGKIPKRIETCPRRLAKPGTDFTILRCCLLETTIEVDAEARTAVVPWGADTGHVMEALKKLLAPAADQPHR